MFLLGFRALYFEIAKKRDFLKRYSDPYIPTQWILTAIMGDSLAPGGGPNTQEESSKLKTCQMRFRKASNKACMPIELSARGEVR